MTTAPASEDEHEIVPAEILPEAGRCLSITRVRTWSLVLEARQVPHRVLRRGWEWTILVPHAQREQAEYEIRTYEEKNRHWPPRNTEIQTRDHTRETLSLLLLLAIFHNLTLLDPGPLGLRPEQWYEQGAAHAAAIRNGQWWRTVTALTLHIDWRHLTGNLILGGLFAARLCAVTGFGRGWALILASGMAGNLINAWLQTGSHRAVGASTAVFGTIGILCAMETRRRDKAMNLRRFLPLAAGAALLAMFGAGGENTDLGAHLFGFLAGLGLGYLVPEPRASHPTAHSRFGWSAGLGALALVVAAWTLALRHSF